MAAVAASRDGSPVPPASRGSAGGGAAAGADPLLSLLSVLDMDGSPAAAMPNAASAVEAAVLAAEAAANAAYGAVKSMAA